MWLGLEANYCTELTLLELNKKVSYVLMISSMMLFLTAAFGWTAAATKNDCLSYCVSALFFKLIYILVWLPRHVHLFDIHINGCFHIHCQIKLSSVDE